METNRDTRYGKRHPEEFLRRYAAVIEESDDAIIGKTPGGIITSWDGAAERFFGFSAAETIGVPGVAAELSEYTRMDHRTNRTFVIMPQHSGIQIGMENVRRTISSHGGRTRAGGRSGEGAVFFFSIPASAGARLSCYDRGPRSA